MLKNIFQKKNSKIANLTILEQNPKHGRKITKNSLEKKEICFN